MEPEKYFISAVLILLSGCSAPPSKMERYSETRPLMHTVIQLDVCRDSSNEAHVAAAYEEVWQRLEEISWRMNVYDDRSDVARINHSYPEAVKIPEDTHKVIKASLDFNALSHGAFDITVQPLIQLWKAAEKKGAMPTPEELAAVLTAVGPKNIELRENNEIMLKNAGTRLDLGGIAAGYAVDEAARIYRKHGIVNFYIDIGGDMYVGGMNCEGNLWRIGIRDPRDKEQLIDVVLLSDKAVATSGNYEKFYMIGDKKWSHIMDPRTGFPEEEVVAATLIAPTALETDGLSTAVTVLGMDKGAQLIDSLGKGYAGIIFVKEGDEGLIRKESQEYQNFKLKR